ncbi:fungal-specific transcription factor domain-containing protein [Mycena latifolia]|nr:fungal-specific transcription factor domain-containing protein [Mycena latifolia]
MGSEGDCKDRATRVGRRKASLNHNMLHAILDSILICENKLHFSGKGDSAEMPENKCTNCITSNIECTHAYARLKAGENPPAAPVPITAQQHVANILSATTVYIPPANPQQVLIQVARYARSLEEKLAALQPQTIVPKSRSPMPSSIEEDSPSLEALVDDDDQAPIRDPLGGLIDAKPDAMFYGKSSSVQFIKSAIKHIHGNASVVVGVQRPEFWTTQPWEKLVIETPQHIFPENDLLKSLIKIYFEQINPIIGILHFPSFRQSVAEGLHFRDQHFGAVVLAVCSLASRTSEDPRVLLDGVNSEHSCGWKWFRQVRPLRTSFSPYPSLRQLQLICLSVLYLAGTSHPEECWILAGLGLRFAQGAGAHHWSGYSRMEPVEAELYKHIFYMLVATDTILSSFKGRPRITHSVDFDLDPPINCDEEYWGIPNAVQPRGKPSTSAFLVAYVPLMTIFGRIQQAVYPVNGQPPSSETIAELDSELNKWVDALPEHRFPSPVCSLICQLLSRYFVSCSPDPGPTAFAALILIHRPFIPAPGKESMANTTFPSLAICANAARSCGHVLDVQTRRGRGLLHHPQIMTVLFDCAVVLLINVWAVVGKSRTPERYNRATADVQNCVRVLRLYERRWRVAGRKCDIISAMLNIGKYTSDAPSLKRPRDMEERVTTSPDVSEVSLGSSENRPIAGTSRAMSVAQQIKVLELSIQETEHLFSLPLHTEELGRLPIYDSFDYKFTFQSADVQYQPESHLDSQDEMFGPIDLQFLYGVDPPSTPDFPNQGSNFHSPQAGSGGTPSGDEIKLDYSFDIPSGDGWRDWSTYLANVDGLNQRGF